MERMVRSTKAILKKILDSKKLTDFSLISFITSVERILNDRPSTFLTDDVRDFNVLTRAVESEFGKFPTMESKSESEFLRK